MATSHDVPRQGRDGNGPPDSAIDRKLESARRRLLDISARNRLLNFLAGRQAERDDSSTSNESNDSDKGPRRRTDRRSLQLINVDAADLYQLLVRDEKTIDFVASDEGPGLVENSDPAAVDLTDQSTPQGSRKKPQARVDLVGEQLDKRLLFLARDAESALQEQGCNVLYLSLGLLEWSASESGDDSSFAPVILLPVELNRRDVKQRYKMRWLDEAPIVNPTLVELCRSNFRLEIPQLDTESEAPVESLLGALAQQIAPIKGWAVHHRVHLGLFSFAKLLMYLDLDSCRWPQEIKINTHPLVQALCGIRGMADFGNNDALLPATELDEKVPPHDTFQVMDADSSQQVAVLAAKKGSSMVVEGPPGTGKSQTITNIIAECLAAGKTVLFVAEKAAALDVVKRRLDRVGLGDFVLELHSRKAGKRKILEELDRTLRADYPAFNQAAPDAEMLKSTRGRLNEYVRVLHEKITPFEMSLFEAMGGCALLRDAAEAPFAIPDITTWDRSRFDQVEEKVKLFSRAAGRIGNPSRHPWRGVGLREVPLHIRQQLPVHLAKLHEAIQQTLISGSALAQRLQATPPASRQDAQQLIDVVKAILNAPGVSGTNIASPVWNSLPSEVATALSNGRRIAALRSSLSVRWHATAEDFDWNPVIIRRKQQQRSFFRWFSPAWYGDSKLIRQYMQPDRKPQNLQVLEDLGLLNELRQCRAALQPVNCRCAELFGAQWQGESSDWDSLEALSQALVGVRQLIVAGRTTAEGVAAVCNPAGRQELKQMAKGFVSPCNEMFARRKELADLLLLNLTEFLGGEPEATHFDVWIQRLSECRPAVEALQDWIDYTRHHTAIAEDGLKPFLSWCASDGLTAGSEQWSDAFRRQFLRLWLDRQFATHPSFRDYQGDTLESLVARFREADRHWLELSRVRLVAMVAARRPQQQLVASKNSKLGILQAELRKKRSLKPIRQLLGVVGDVVQSLKPCFMMSPISVAQYLEPGKLQFDVVIFDEASQVEPADALGAVARGSQLILVGDEKQLPPTGFFTSVNAASDEDDDPENLDTGDLESILAAGQVCLPLKTRLRWHYRSRHSSLIAFSNSQFYDGELRVFPSPHIERDGLGLSMRFLPHGIYQRGKGQFNPIEATEVAKEVLLHATQFPERSLGVGAFSMAHQRAIEDELELLRRESHDPTIEEFFSPGRNEPFFVKNLETIQGDERDVIFLSVGYGPDDNGRLTMNFGPLNRDGGWRRLNVLITRARERCVVFTSFKAAQMRLEPASPRGVQALKDFLQFAEYGTLPTIDQYTNDHDSPFEQDVCRALRQQGWDVHAQVGCAGFAIDLAVVDPQSPGQYLLGIECDGATYHSAATARDRDRLRQTVLEGLGWKIHRIWSTDWFERRQQTLEHLLKVVNEISERRKSPTAMAETGATVISNARDDLLHPTGGEVPPVQPESSRSFSASSTSDTQPAPPTNQPNIMGQVTTAAPPSSTGPPPGMSAYCRFRGAQLGDRNRLLAMDRAEAMRLMAEVVRVEGPIHVEELDRCVAAMFQARVTGQVKDLLESIRQYGARHNQLIVRGQFVWPVGMEHSPIRWRGGEDAVSDAEMICPEEVAEVAVWVTQHEFGVPLDDLPAATIRAMGFKRIGPQLAALGVAGVQHALETRRIAADPGGFMVARP